MCDPPIARVTACAYVATGWTGLPEDISASMCSTCGSVFSPGVNCRVRVRHRSLASPGAAKKKKINPNTTAAAATKKGPRKCLNEVVSRRR